jgi:phytoene dehydrogenase-like protein
VSGGEDLGERLDPHAVLGFRFDTHSAAHNIINATDIVDDLRLREVGLEYREMDLFSVAVFGDGRIVRFHRDVEHTVASIAEVDPDEARRYREWIHDAVPVVTAFRAGLDAGAGAWANTRRLPGRARASAAALRRNGGPLGLARLLLSPYGRVLRERFDSDLVRGPVSAFAAHASASPNQPGSALFALWQAFYHQVGQWHAVGGSQGLTDALAGRLAASGGEWRTGAAVARITCRDGGVDGVELEDGEHLAADAVVTAVDPRTALLDLLDPPLDGAEAARLRAAHSGNAVQMLVLLATTRLPAYGGARPGDDAGLQSYVDTLDSLSAGFARAEARQLPEDPVPTYSFTPSALDTGLAPPGHHTVYLATPTAPFEVDGGWDDVAEAFADRMIDTVESRVPGFRSTIVGRAVRTPALMASELRWPGAHPMYLDVSLDQLGPLRPTPALGRHRTPVRSLYVSGAGTAPVGGISGIPGRSAARTLLRTMTG